MQPSDRPDRDLFFKNTYPLLDALGLCFFAFLYLRAIPLGALTLAPATGGDMGSHFWPLYALKNYGFEHFRIRIWNPGNLAGEPLLLHYFPFPFLIMGALGFVLPLAVAYNVGTLLPILALPFCIYFAVRRLGFQFPAPLIAAGLSLCFLYNDSYSMWGGNIFSTLAGQFAHAYAFDFLFLGLGFLASEIRSRKIPLFSSLSFSALATSHAYVWIVLPVFMISICLFFKESNFRQRLRLCFWSFLTSTLLSVWFLWPMVDNSKWTTAFGLEWRFANFWHEVVPPIFYPPLAIIVLSLIVLGFEYKKRDQVQHILKTCAFWLVPILFYVGFYFVAFRAGLVDVRAFPQIQLFICILAGVLAGGAAATWVPSPVLWVLTVPILMVIGLWTNSKAPNLSSWMNWNYSGWTSKALYADLKNLTTHLKGNFSDPRVIYEQSDLNNSAGTVRVFEMLPYFSGRSTLESVYLQANLVSPQSFNLQALISRTPSCPFVQWPCPRFNLIDAYPKLQLMGVSQLILTSKELNGLARQNSHYQFEAIFGPWSVYRLDQPPTYAEVLTETPTVEERTSDWRNSFVRWGLQYTGREKFLVVDPLNQNQNFVRDLQRATPADQQSHEPCRPLVKVDFSQIDLETSCPGRLHYLKFAFHPAWVASSGDPLFEVSPWFYWHHPFPKSYRASVRGTVFMDRSQSHLVCGSHRASCKLDLEKETSSCCLNSSVAIIFYYSCFWVRCPLMPKPII